MSARCWTCPRRASPPSVPTPIRRARWPLWCVVPPVRPFGIRRVIADMAASTELFYREAPAVLRALEVEAVLADQMEPAGALLAEHLGLPFVSIACALPFNREPLVPLPVMPWRYRATDWGEQLNRHSSGVYDRLMRPHGEVIERYCRVFGTAGRTSLSDCLSPLLGQPDGERLRLSAAGPAATLSCARPAAPAAADGGWA